MGLLAGSFARRSGGLAAPLLLHAGNNALAFVRIAQGLGGG
jgi:membrane protease YdiL (CAAX protease family)